MSSKIEACPFCGSEKCSPNYQNARVWVDCDSCGVRGRTVSSMWIEEDRGPSIEEAILLWNKRAAPVVERQEPVKTPEMPYKMLPLEEDGWFQCVNAYEAMCPLYTAPPELAELQATIARLTAENERLRESDNEGTELCDTLSSLLGQIAVAVRGAEDLKSRHGFGDLPSRVKAVVSEIERLKGGQGEAK